MNCPRGQPYLLAHSGLACWHYGPLSPAARGLPACHKIKCLVHRFDLLKKTCATATTSLRMYVRAAESPPIRKPRHIDKSCYEHDQAQNKDIPPGCFPLRFQASPQNLHQPYLLLFHNSSFGFTVLFNNFCTSRPVFFPSFLFHLPFRVSLALL